MILSFAAVLRVQARLIRWGVVPRVHRPRRVREALLLAREIVGEVRRDRIDAWLSIGPRADETTAVLVAFASVPAVFGRSPSTLRILTDLVHAQARNNGWRLMLDAPDLTSLIVEVMFRADGGRSIDYAGLAETLWDAMEPWGRREENPRKHPAGRRSSPARSHRRQAAP